MTSRDMDIVNDAYNICTDENKYFPDEEIEMNDLYFVCYMRVNTKYRCGKLMRKRCKKRIKKDE